MTAAERSSHAVSSVEDLGTTKRLLRRPMTAADRQACDERLHALIDARAAVEAGRTKLVKAARKLAQRLRALDEQVEHLHGTWKSPEIEEVVTLRVERSPSELRLIRMDNGLVHSRRPLTAEEHQILSARLPGAVGEVARVPHPELDADAATEEREAAERSRAEAREKLASPIDIDDVLAEVDREEEPEDDAEENGGKKRRARAKQAELPLGGED